jgi:hypothetical protein
LDIIPQAKPFNAFPSALLGVVAKQKRIAQCSMNTDAFGLGWEEQERLKINVHYFLYWESSNGFAGRI